jgi:hypothetical protein
MEDTKEIMLEVVSKESSKRTRKQTVEQASVKKVEVPTNVNMIDLQRWASMLRRRHFNSVTHQEAVDAIMADNELLQEFKNM